MEPRKSSFSKVGPARYLTFYVQSGYDLHRGCPGCGCHLILYTCPIIQCEHCLAVIKICPEVPDDHPSLDF